MSKEIRKAFEEALELRENSSVFDFFYQDSRRVGSYLAQFDPSGHLLSIKQTEHIETSTQQDAGGEIGGSAFIAKGKAQFSDRVISASKDAAERTFDPLWTNAITLLTYLQQKNLVKRDISEARIGNFVLCEGEFLIADTSFLQKFYTTSEKQNHARANTRGINGQPLSESDFNLQLAAFQNLPQQIQIHLSSDTGKIWSLLQPEYMTVPAGEIMMKHGAVVEGKWHILGIKDGEPTKSVDNFLEIQKKLSTAYPLHPFINETLTTSHFVRGWVGRPIECYGVTPILIFREIGKQ